MTFEMFCEQLKTAIEGRYLGNVSVEFQKVLKNNGLLLTGLIIRDNNTNISPTIYLDPFFNKIKESSYSFEGICEEILFVYEHNKLENDINFESFTDINIVKKSLFCKLINYENNMELLKDVPYRRFLDLAIVPYYLVKIQEFDVGGSVLIHYSHMEHWNIEAEELLEYAINNTHKIISPQITDLYKLITALDGIKDNQFDETNALGNIFVLTNEDKFYGAVCMTDLTVLFDFAQKYNSDLIILPSSIHEVLIVLCDNPSEINEYTNLVKHVNSTQLCIEEILSDHAYYFDKQYGFVE